MKKYFCDVCGVELSGRRGDVAVANLTGPAAALCKLEDLCKGCAKLADSLDTAGLVLAELRRLAGEKDAPPVIMGRGAVQKRAILAALNDFRQRRGPGAIPALADMSGVDETVIRDMATCQKVPLADWRRVGKALGVPESDTGTEMG